MNVLEFENTKQQLISRYSGGIQIESDEQLLGQFTMVSAGLSNFIPEIPFLEHKRIFTELLLHNKISLLEQGFSEMLQYTKLEGYTGEIERTLKNQAAIICTFHTGSYRLINQVLIEKGIHYSLVVSHEVVENEGKGFKDTFKRLAGNGPMPGIIDAESPGASLRMIRELKTGRSLLIYIDGNTGSGLPTLENLNNQVVNFLGQQLVVRIGVGYLAHLVKVPVIGVVCFRFSWSDIRLRFFEPFYPPNDISRVNFATQVSQRLYDMVAPFIREYPEQWESWLYVHKFAHIGDLQYKVASDQWPIKGNDFVVFNSARFGLFNVAGRPHLLEKNSYISYPIERVVYKLLSHCQTAQVRARLIQRSLLRALLKMGVLVKTQ